LPKLWITASALKLDHAVHRHILKMADELSRGIVTQFPRRFG
jgi:hypothetical protein